MSIQSRQALRLLKFVAELKMNNYPNAASFARLLRKTDVEESLPFKCAISERTIKRDIRTLIDDYGAPIAYDPENHGYFLLKPDWCLPIPIMDDDEILSMAMLGTRLASDILPEPVKGQADSALEKTLAGNSSVFFNDAMIESILCATGIKSAVDPKVFKKIFDAWRQHQVISLVYHKPNKPASVRRFEPHIIAFRNGIWYAKGYEKGAKEAKVYAIQRITDVSNADDTFVSDKKLIEDTRKNGLFVYPKISGIRLRCDASIAFYLREHQHVKKFRIETQDDGSLIISLLPAVEHEVIRWILGESGKVEVLYPPGLRAKVAAAAKLIYERNQPPVAAAPGKKTPPAPKAKAKKAPAGAGSAAPGTYSPASAGKAASSKRAKSSKR